MFEYFIVFLIQSCLFMYTYKYMSIYSYICMYTFIKKNLDFVNFLDDYNRYKIEIFRVYLLFNELFNDVSQFDVA